MTRHSCQSACKSWALRSPAGSGGLIGWLTMWLMATVLSRVGCRSADCEPPPQRDGYGRYFRIRNNLGDVIKGDLFLCVNFGRWATSGDTPLWLWISSNLSVNAPQLRVDVPSVVEYGSNGPYDAPIYLTAGVEYERVLADVVRQIKDIAKVVRIHSQP